MEQKIETGRSQGSLFRDPPPRPQKDEWSERETVHPAVSARNARDAAIGHNVRYVLGFGLVAIIIAFIAVYAVYFA